jgi:hypothetical protein
MPDARIRRYSRDPIRDKFVERKESMAGFSILIVTGLCKRGYCVSPVTGIQIIMP